MLQLSICSIACSLQIICEIQYDYFNKYFLLRYFFLYILFCHFYINNDLFKPISKIFELNITMSNYNAFQRHSATTLLLFLFFFFICKQIIHFNLKKKAKISAILFFFHYRCKMTSRKVFLNLSDKKDFEKIQ